MNQLNFNDKCQAAVAWALVKLGKLTFDAFTEAELTELLEDVLPHTLDVPVPAGQASLSCVFGSITMPKETQRVTLTLDTHFKVSILGNPVYQAHICVVASALPRYDTAIRRLLIEDVRLDSITLINDEYRVIHDTTSLLRKLTPLSLAESLANPLKSIVNRVTGGLSDGALNYLQGLTRHNKQRLLDDHQPAIESALLDYVHDSLPSIEMRDDVWREWLFARLGKRVIVEQNELRFYFT